MNINLSQQISATYARNNFKEVMDRALKEGMIVIMRKSSPELAIISIKDLKKIENPEPKKKKIKKFDLAILKQNNPFYKYAGCLDGKFDKNLSSVEISKQWTKYVD